MDIIQNPVKTAHLMLENVHHFSIGLPKLHTHMNLVVTEQKAQPITKLSNIFWAGMFELIEMLTLDCSSCRTKISTRKELSKAPLGPWGQNQHYKDTDFMLSVPNFKSISIVTVDQLCFSDAWSKHPLADVKRYQFELKVEPPDTLFNINRNKLANLYDIKMKRMQQPVIAILFLLKLKAGERS